MSRSNLFFEIIFWLFFFYPTNWPNFSSGGQWELKHFIWMVLTVIIKIAPVDDYQKWQALIGWELHPLSL